MTPSDIVIAITQLVRLGQAWRDARTSSVLESELRLVLDEQETVSDFLADALQPEHRGALLLAVPQCEEFLGAVSGLKAECPEPLREHIRAYGRKVSARRRSMMAENADTARLLDLDRSTALVIKAWTDENAPPTPWRRFGLAALQVSLEVAAANPSMFKTSANGEKLISAVIGNVIQLLPDPNNASHWRVSFAERTTSILLTASARVIEEHADTIWEQPRLQEFGRAIVAPLRARLDRSASGASTGTAYQLARIENVRDELLAPMTHAALSVVAKHQRGFLGDSFDTDQLLGAMTQTFLQSALDDEDGRVLRVFSKTGFVHVYERMLNLVGERPELFIHGKSDATEVARRVLAESALALNGAPAPFGKDVAAQVTAAALEAVAGGLPSLIDAEGDWDQAGVSVLQSVVSGFAQGVAGRDANVFTRVFSRDQAVEMVRLIAAQAAATPGMLVGGKANPEVKRIAAHMAQLIAAPGASLLAPAQWSVLTTALLREAAANPGALFSLDEGTAEQGLAINLVSDLFGLAAETYSAQGGRQVGARLFGSTLADAASAVARAAVRNVEKATSPTGQAAAINLARRLVLLSATHPSKVSDHDWRYLYKTWIAEVIDKGAVPNWSDDELIDMLYITEERPAAPADGGETGEAEEPNS